MVNREDIASAQARDLSHELNELWRSLSLGERTQMELLPETDRVTWLREVQGKSLDKTERMALLMSLRSKTEKKPAPKAPAKPEPPKTSKEIK